MPFPKGPNNNETDKRFAMYQGYESNTVIIRNDNMSNADRLVLYQFLEDWFVLYDDSEYDMYGEIRDYFEGRGLNPADDERIYAVYSEEHYQTRKTGEVGVMIGGYTKLYADIFEMVYRGKGTLSEAIGTFEPLLQSTLDNVFINGIRYNIQLDTTGGTLANHSVSTGSTGVLTNTLPIPEREGYEFDGWYTAEQGGSLITYDHIFNRDTTIYARWTQLYSGKLQWVSNAQFLWEIDLYESPDEIEIGNWSGDMNDTTSAAAITVTELESTIEYEDSYFGVLDGDFYLIAAGSVTGAIAPENYWDGTVSVKVSGIEDGDVLIFVRDNKILLVYTIKIKSGSDYEAIHLSP